MGYIQNLNETNMTLALTCIIMKENEQTSLNSQSYETLNNPLFKW